MRTAVTLEEALRSPEAAPPTHKAILDVIAQLDAYKGETVVAYAHPLHHAVVALEAACIPGPKQNLLYTPARAFWFKLLWASRDGRPTYPLASGSSFFTAPREPNGPADPVVAMAWAIALHAELLRWVVVINDYEARQALTRFKAHGRGDV